MFFSPAGKLLCVWQMLFSTGVHSECCIISHAMMQYIAALIGRATICTSSWRQECVLLPCRGPASFNAAAATLQWRFKHFNDGLLLLTLLEPQSRYGDNRLKLQVVCPPNGTAVLKGLKAILNMCARSLAPRVRFFVGEESLKCVV